MSARTIERIVEEAANRAGISKAVPPRFLRHTFSVERIKKGISTGPFQALLGHNRSTTTEIHLNLSPEDAIREFLDK